MIVAAIPVRNNLKWTAPLVEQLLLADEIDELWVYDNGSTDMTAAWVMNRAQIDSRLMYKDMRGQGLYDMWNHMIRTAASIGGVRLAILNNDIRLPHRALWTMARQMQGFQLACIDKELGSFDPIYDAPPVEAWWAERTGWAFMLDADFWKEVEHPIHPTLKIWWGDDDLFRGAQTRGGRICRVLGVGCDHAEQASDSEYQGDKWIDVEFDRLEFIRIWDGIEQRL